MSALDAPYPTAGSVAGDPIPDLGAIDPGEWFAVLEPLGRYAREYAERTLRRPEDLYVLWDVLDRLREHERDLAGRRRSAGSTGLSELGRRPGAAPRPGARQVNVRLSAGAHARLVAAAERLDASPTQLARTLIVNGANQVLREAPPEP